MYQLLLLLVGSATAIYWGSNDLAQDCDFVDQNLSNEPSTSATDCAGKCNNNPQCTHFAWSNYQGGTCWLKKGQVSKTDAVAAAGVQCGVKSQSSSSQGSSGVPFVVLNQCSYTVWPGFYGKSVSNPSFMPFGGGWELPSGQSSSFQAPSDLSAARIWGRTGCSEQGNTFNCETGGCGTSLQCNGTTGKVPVTLAEFTLKDTDNYDVSVVDGFNLPLKIKVGSANCPDLECAGNINDNCPEAQRVQTQHGQTIACFSACAKFDTDAYCCRGQYATPDKCQPSNSAFKSVCQQAYSFAYDDKTSLKQCENSGYQVIFCP